MSENLLIDLNLIACYFGVPTDKGASNEHRQNYFFSGHGILATLRIPQMCCAIPRRLQGAKIFMYGSIFMHGFCATDLSRKPARHHGMFTIHATKTLSHGHPGLNIQKHISRRQQSTRLAYLRRLCANFNSSSPRTLSGRFLRDRFERYGLCLGLNNHRSVSVAFSMGPFSKEQGCDQTSHASGSAWTYSVIYQYHRRKSSGCQCSGHPDPRSRVVLHHGPRVSRLHAFVYDPSGPCNICHPDQIQYAIPAPVLTPGRQNNRASVRPNDRLNQRAISQRLSGATSLGQILRCPEQEILQVPDQQLRYRRDHRSATLQMPLESRTLFSLDQTAFAHQGFFRDITKRRQDTNLDRNLNLRDGRHYQKTFEPQSKSLHNFTNFERDHFRQNAYIASTYEN